MEGYACGSGTCPLHIPTRPLSNTTSTSFSTRSAPWNPASIRSASSLSSRQSCVMGKEENASRLSEPNLVVLEYPAYRPSYHFFPRAFVPCRVCFKGLGSPQGLGSPGSWTLIHSYSRGLQLLFPFCSIGDNYAASTPSILHIVLLFSMHCHLVLVPFLSARACLLCLSLSLLLGLVSFCCCIYSIVRVGFLLVLSIRTLLLLSCPPSLSLTH